MWQFIRENRKAVIFAVLVHVVFAAVLIFSFNFSSPQVAVNPDTRIVKARVIDEAKIKQERERQAALQHQKEQARKAAERKKKLEAQKKAEARRQAELKKKREKEQQLALKKKQEAERKKKLEAQKKAEAERLKQEQQRQAEAEQKKQQEAERKAREAELKKQLEEEQRLMAEAAKRAAQQKDVDRYQALIKQAISNKWRIPVSAKVGQECVLKLRLIPSGDVVSVEVVKSSGDTIFDRSVEAAVYKASPLPLPPADSGLFDEFREINMPFRLEQKT